jgi:hypothetical protein
MKGAVFLLVFHLEYTTQSEYMATTAAVVMPPKIRVVPSRIKKMYIFRATIALMTIAMPWPRMPITAACLVERAFAIRPDWDAPRVIHIPPRKR